jgi:enoyl-CoA hydratase/carnithine racemase
MLAASTGVVGAAEAAAARDRAWASADLQEGLAAFQARRRPDFTGR